jgi:beta-lactamase class D
MHLSSSFRHTRIHVIHTAAKRYLIALFILSFACRAAAIEWEARGELGKLFADAGVQGTFVLYDVAAERFVGHDRARAETRFIPASTFKLVNSLIGLSVGAVADVDSVLPYGGGPQPYKNWERDMGLREAIRVSNVPIYRELARRVGLLRMRENLARIGYGNDNIGAVVDRFWLDGPLRISAVEQARFLAALARGSLPFPAEVQAQAREIALLEQGDGWTLYGKTGWADSYDPDLGWWVGWVVTSSDLDQLDGSGLRIHAFALNIDMPQSTDAAKRQALGKACLRALGIL